MSALGALRVLWWTLAWAGAAQVLGTYWLGWSWWLTWLASVPFAVVASGMASERSLAWRWAIVRNWSRMQRPLVIDEDGNLRGGMLPFEEVHVIGNDDGPIEGHVHTRTLVLGRPRLRAETQWRAWPEE